VTPAFDPATTAWVAAVVAASGTVSAAQKTRVNTLIVSLKAASLFTVLDRLWLLASENTQQAGIDIVNLNASLTVSGAPSFTANLGYICNNILKFLDTHFVPSTAGGHYVLNGASFGYYNITVVDRQVVKCRSASIAVSRLPNLFRIQEALLRSSM